MRKELFLLCITDLMKLNILQQILKWIFKEHIQMIKSSGFEFLNPKLLSEFFLYRKTRKKILINNR